MDWTKIITESGFAIAACVALAWFVYILYKASERREEKLMAALEESREINAKFASICQTYTIKLDSIEQDVKVIKDDVVLLMNQEAVK